MGFLFLLTRVRITVSCVITGLVKLDSVNANVKKRVFWCYALATFLSKLRNVTLSKPHLLQC